MVWRRGIWFYLAPGGDIAGPMVVIEKPSPSTTRHRGKFDAPFRIHITLRCELRRPDPRTAGVESGRCPNLIFTKRGLLVSTGGYLDRHLVYNAHMSDLRALLEWPRWPAMGGFCFLSASGRRGGLVSRIGRPSHFQIISLRAIVTAGRPKSLGRRMASARPRIYAAVVCKFPDATIPRTPSPQTTHQ